VGGEVKSGGQRSSINQGKNQLGQKRDQEELIGTRKVAVFMAHSKTIQGMRQEVRSKGRDRLTDCGDG